jgi:hypothetical protein
MYGDGDAVVDVPALALVIGEGRDEHTSPSSSSSDDILAAATAGSGRMNCSNFL